MSLSYAILAILVSESCSGYDLAKQFDGSVGYFWTASHQQIYRELNRLEQRGWIEGEVVPQSGRPNKTVYQLTARGKQEMRAWIDRPSTISPSKEDILVKLFAGALVEPQVLLRALQQYRQLHQQQLQVYEGIAQDHFAHPEHLSQSAKCQYLTLRKGIRYELDCIGWCNEAIAFLDPALP